MTWLRTILILGAAFLAVFWEAAFQGIRYLTGVQLDFLPALMVFASLQGNLTTVCLLAFGGGMLFDSLSANPLGITVLPLLAVGAAFHAKRDLILKDQLFAQLILGLIASSFVPAAVLIVLLSSGSAPLFGWGTAWHLVVMTIGGAAATPVVFVVFDWLERNLGPTRAPETSFRSDREIRRGR